MFKKVCKTILCISACFSLACIPVLADEDDTTGSNGISKDGLTYYYSDEYQQILKDKISMVPITEPRAATKLLNTPEYTQIDKTHCGPASAQIIIKYKTGVYYDQTYLGDLMGTGVGTDGTYVDALTPVLKNLTGLDYEFTSNKQYYFFNNMVQDINGDCPIIYDVDPFYFYNGYPHMGHYVVGNGYGSDMCYYWDVNGNKADEWHISAPDMSVALNALEGGYYVW